jgi:hypothetical protein
MLREPIADAEPRDDYFEARRSGVIAIPRIVASW